MELYKEILNKPLNYRFFSNSKTSAYRKIKKLMNKGEIIKIGKNKYVFSDADPFKLCFYIYKGFFSFSTALFLRGFKQEGEKNLYIIVPSYKKKINFKNLNFIPVKTSYHFPFSSFVKDVPVAKLERIIFDSLNIPKYAEFYYLLYAIKLNKNKIDWEILKKFILSSNKSTIRRAGFFLEGIAPSNFIEELYKNKGKGISYLKNSSLTLSYNKRWNLYAPSLIKKWKDELIT